MQILQLSTNIFGLFLLIASMMLNTFLGVDLILMIKYPFKVKDKRMPWYVMLSFLIAAFLALATLFTLYKSEETSTWITKEWVYRLIMVVLVIYVLASVFSILYALKKLWRAKIS